MFKYDADVIVLPSYLRKIVFDLLNEYNFSDEDTEIEAPDRRYYRKRKIHN